ncbi:MAG: hypothetical protein PHP98_04760 [Kiritimatiellae bacterium]|jgi:hypothetical protein|nr:hypothetical protein [Kiritimatiellia bacterium]
MKKHVLLIIGLLCVCGWNPSVPAQGEKKGGRDRLYTVPDANAGGGISGRIELPARAPENVLAIPPDDPAKVYQARLGPDRSFSFTGLPMGRYDLLVIYDDAFYEGLRLHRGANDLTAADVKNIHEIIRKSEPFFSHKIIHRLEGSSGRGQNARAICTFYRDTPAETYMFEVRTGYRRTFKLVMLANVGPGWQIARARDLHPVWTEPEKQSVRHRYHEELSNIRVTDSVRDLGGLKLTGK